MVAAVQPVSPGSEVDQTRQTERDFFDSLVDDQGSFNPFNDEGWQTLSHRFREWTGQQRFESLLDIGCGTGESRQIYIDQVDNYTGLDLSAASIRLAEQRFPDSQWATGDACSLPYAADSFDAVTFSSVLHHINNFEVALAEAFRVVRPGGFVFAFDPNVWHPAMALFRHPSSPLYLSQGVSPNEKPLRPVVLRTAFQKAGFVELRQRCQSNIPYREVAPRLINACLSVYNTVDRAWEASGLGRWFGTFVLTAGRKATGAED